jgi:hypothetical protein
VEVDTGVNTLAGHENLSVAKACDAGHLRVDHPLHQSSGDGRIYRITTAHQHPRAGFRSLGLGSYDHSFRHGVLRSSSLFMLVVA